MSEAESEWVGLIWLSGKPLVPGVSCCRVGGAPRQQQGRREVSIHTARWPAELRQQNQQSVSSGQLQEVHSKNHQGPSKSQREPVRLLRVTHQKEYCWTGFLKNPRIQDVLCEVAQRLGFDIYTVFDPAHLSIRVTGVQELCSNCDIISVKI